MTEKDALIPVGKITGTHGIKGLLKVHSYSGNIESLKSAAEITLRSAQGVLNSFKLQSVAQHGTRLIIGFKGYDNINLVQTFVGNEICLFRNQLPPTEDDEYYWCDLLGLEVVTVDGTRIGTITDIFATGSSDIYVVSNEGQEHLIPAIANVIHTVDVKNGKMLITPMEGLLDI